MKKTLCYTVIGLALAGCGSDDPHPGVMPGFPPSGNLPSDPSQGQGDTDNQPPTDSVTPPDGPNSSFKLISGIYKGRSDLYLNVEGLIDDNKNLWFIYSDSENNIEGFVASNDKITGNSGKFTVSGKDFSEVTEDITITGNYQEGNKIFGAMARQSSNQISYSVTYDKVQSEVKQSLQNLSGRSFFGESYMTADDRLRDTLVRFDAGGNFTGSSAGCNFTGNMRLSESKIYFISSLTFNGIACDANGQTFPGVALLNEDNDLIFLGKKSSTALYFYGSSR